MYICVCTYYLYLYAYMLYACMCSTNTAMRRCSVPKSSGFVFDVFYKGHPRACAANPKKHQSISSPQVIRTCSSHQKVQKVDKFADMLMLMCCQAVGCP